MDWTSSFMFLHVGADLIFCKYRVQIYTRNADYSLIPGDQSATVVYRMWKTWQQYWWFGNDTTLVQWPYSRTSWL